MPSTPNPYEPVEVDGSVEVPATRSYMMTLIAGLLALVPAGFATIILLETISVAQRQGFSDDVKKAAMVFAGFLAFASIWLTVAYFAWAGKKQRLLTITLLNFFAFAVFFVYLAM
ncbi:MAG: hypothetical protein WBD31_12940 [Rubripirellula sp.]